MADTDRPLRPPRSVASERPSYRQLLAEIEESGYCAVGRKYGVSDNAVRKWARFYQRQMEREAEDEGGSAEVAA